MKKRLAYLIPIFLILYLLYASNNSIQLQDIKTVDNNLVNTTKGSTLNIPTPTSTRIISIPQSHIIFNNYHIFQTFNNCGPAALSMALSFYGINKSQEELGMVLRPYQNPQGDNDDKSVTLEELAEKSKDYGFIPYHRPNGNIELLKKLVYNNMPVITRTWLSKDEDIGHYRVIKGYDEAAQILLQDDSLQGKNLEYTYDEFNNLWEKFNFEYLVLVPKEKEEIVKEIIGKDVNMQVAWSDALNRSKEILDKNPNDIYARFNMSVAYYHIGDYQKSVIEFEKIEQKLPFRTLWYQIEPIKAYYNLGNDRQVFLLTDKILNNYNRAFSELYLLRGDIYKKQGDFNLSKQEYQKAIFYNKNLNRAQQALNSI